MKDIGRKKMAERKRIPRGLLDPESQAIEEAYQALPSVRSQVFGLLGIKDKQDAQSIANEIRKTPWFKEYVEEYGEEPNLSESADYDYITAWKAGIRPERDQYDNNRYHWSSKTPDGAMLKKPGHSTLWKTHFMDQTGQNPDAIGIKTERQAEQFLKDFNKDKYAK